ncbi:MAG: 3'(2'),5'-bisphosphate nucleotidase CysQ [Nanoarchaeota archaeon]
MNLDREIQAAIEAARGAGKILLESRHLDLETRAKQDGSPVCIADTRSADYLISFMRERFPDYGILCEETVDDDDRASNERSWIIDPLDGTQSYIKGRDTFGVIIGLMQDGEAVLGVTHLPMKDETLYAAKGRGAYRDGKTVARIHVVASDEIDMLVSGSRNDASLQEIISRLAPVRLRTMHTSFKTTEIAKGEATVFACPPSITMNLWDLCGPAAILEEAGGKVTDLYGRPIDYRAGTALSYGILATNGRVHDDVLTLLRIH